MQWKDMKGWKMADAHGRCSLSSKRVNATTWSHPEYPSKILRSHNIAVTRLKRNIINLP